MSEDLDQAFNKFADKFLFPSEPSRASTTKGEVSVRTWGFPPSRFGKRKEIPEEETIYPANTCCLYPFPDPFSHSGGAFYPATDLPDSVVLNGSTLAKVAPGTGVHSDYEYGDATTFPCIFITVSLDIWLSLPDGTHNRGSTCLIGSDTAGITITVEDLFPDTYAVDLGGGFTGVVARDKTRSLCKWVGTATDGSTTVAVLLKYDATVYKWKLNGVVHTDPQNTPVGSYGSYTVDEVSFAGTGTPTITITQLL